MKRILSKQNAREIARNCYALRAEEWGMVITDAHIVYHARKDIAHRYENDNYYDPISHPEMIWLHNQGWVIEQTDETAVMPEWTKKRKKACYYPKHNSFTGGDWFASSTEEALKMAKIHWSPLETIQIRDCELVFNNGESGYTGHPIQLWSDGSLSRFYSYRDQKFGDYSKEVVRLLQYAVDSPKSPFRQDKKWRELLDFNGTIDEFESLAEMDTQYLDGHCSDGLVFARAGKYILVRHEWGGLFDGEGDVGDNLFLLEDDGKDIVQQVAQLLK